ncbi:hypothetical protein [Streptomyces sp. KMM 9044]|uniref:hypothetical protein n=1 Tax=Streptomyces sp. KMM 9044 TaxID=2744474 RepID=UPI0021512B12|nr:hypothetical protein [Streptomyces sp. KMM 9044]WAX76887.1 hypothetical protein HUV60_003645 [Streptomyces sp. KMM 9044]
MSAVKRLLGRSLAARAMLILTPGVGGTAPFRRDEHPVVWIVQATLYTGAAVAILAARRPPPAARRPPPAVPYGRRAAGVGPGAVADLNRGIRRGEVPPDPEERAAMRRLADDQLDRIQRAGRWFPYWLALRGLVAAGLLVLGAVSGSVVPSAVFAVGTLGFLWWVVWRRRRSMRRLRTARSVSESPGERV